MVETLDFASFNPVKHVRGHKGRFVKKDNSYLPKTDLLLIETAKSFFRAQERAVINYISNRDGIPTQIPDFSFISINFEERYKRILEHRCLESARNIADTTPALQRAIMKKVDSQVRRFNKSVNKTTEKRLNAALKLYAEMVKSGKIKGSKLGLIKAIKPVFLHAIQFRVLMIGESETLRAINAGEYLAIRTIPEAGKKAWRCRDGCCAHCRALANKGFIDLKDEFVKTKYGVVRYPPLHPFCRCWIEYK